MGDHVVPIVKAWHKLTWRFAHRHMFFKILIPHKPGMGLDKENSIKTCYIIKRNEKRSNHGHRYPLPLSKTYVLFGVYKAYEAPVYSVFCIYDIASVHIFEVISS